MKLTQVAKFRLNFNSKLSTASGALMGMAFFFQALHYFAVADLTAATFGELLLGLALPMLLEAAWFLLLRGLYWDTPMSYGLLGVGVCLVMLVQTLLTASVLSAVFGVLTLLGSAVAILAVTFGYVRSKYVGAGVLALTLVLRLLLGGVPQLLPELANLAALTAVFVLLLDLEHSR